MEKKKVMIFEDDPNVVTVLQAIFQKNDYNVRICNPVQERLSHDTVLEICRQVLDIDVILPDYNLGDITGWEIFETLRADKSLNVKIPIIFIPGSYKYLSPNLLRILGSPNVVITGKASVRWTLDVANALIELSK